MFLKNKTISQTIYNFMIILWSLHFPLTYFYLSIYVSV